MWCASGGSVTAIGRRDASPVRQRRVERSSCAIPAGMGARRAPAWAGHQRPRRRTKGTSRTAARAPAEPSSGRRVSRGRGRPNSAGMLPAPTSRRPLVLASVMAAMFMIAIEATIVSTAMPQIAGRLGDLHFYAWVFSSFLLTQTATTVVFGKLADLHGRRPVLLAGIAVFLAGSLLCGAARSMPSLIAFRLVQGIGAGAVQPVGLTVVGDLYPVHERGRIQGYLGWWPCSWWKFTEAVRWPSSRPARVELRCSDPNREDPMTEDRLPRAELLRKAGEGDFL